MIKRLPWLLLLLLFLAVPAQAQYGYRALLTPGNAIPPGLILEQGGAVGRELAPLVGRSPLLLVYWRPGEAASEQNLLQTAEFVRQRAKGLRLVPVAVLAAAQATDAATKRYAELGIGGTTRLDAGGRFARLVGVTRTPSFVLVDAGGVLRLVGGGALEQSNDAGVTIAEAVESAAAARPVTTLGALPAKAVYRLLRQPLPELAGTELDGRTWRKVSELRGEGKRLLIFYWSPTCPHCKTALPKLRKWYETTKPKDLEIIDIARADSSVLERAIPPIVESYPWPHLLDKDRSIGRSLLVRETPTSYLVGKNGEILAIQVGASVDWARWLSGS